MNNYSNNNASFTGAWKLVSFQIKKDNGDVIYPFGERPEGSILYTDSGKFSAQVMRTDRENFITDNQMTGTTEEIDQSFKSFVSYFGDYAVDSMGGFVTHSVMGSLFPNWKGEDQKRFFEFTGNRLILSTPADSDGVIRDFVWDKI